MLIRIAFVGVYNEKNYDDGHDIDNIIFHDWVNINEEHIMTCSDIQIYDVLVMEELWIDIML